MCKTCCAKLHAKPVAANFARGAQKAQDFEIMKKQIPLKK